MEWQTIMFPDNSKVYYLPNTDKLMSIAGKRKFSSHNLTRGGDAKLWVRCRNVMCGHVVHGVKELAECGYWETGMCPACGKLLPSMSKEMEAPVNQRKFVTGKWAKV